jgi:leucyl aminopeptidase
MRRVGLFADRGENRYVAFMIPTSTDVTVSVVAKAPADAQAIVVFVTQEDSSAPKGLEAQVAAAVNRLLKSGVVRGKAKEITFDVPGDDRSNRRVFVAGLGKREKISAEIIRQSAGALLRALRKHRMNRAAIVLPPLKGISPESAAEAIAGGMLLAGFNYREYKGTATEKREESDDDKPKTIEISIIAKASVAQAVRRVEIVATGQNFARTIASRPGNDINPITLAREAQTMAKEVGLRCTVMDEKELAKLGMGGILAVGGGSIQTPPRMIVLEHQPTSGSGKKGPILVVGKAITFDSGGISIKPADKMGKMIFDKCGGMAVLGLMYCLAKLKSPAHVVGILSAAENAISSKAYRPGDILRMYNGVTVEVTNTDAEGRLVLADALAWGTEKFKPAAIVDLATLTGGVIVALGRSMAGVMSNSDALVKELTEAGESAGEKIWRLPLGDEHRDFIKSDCADIVNSAGREGHVLQGGAFLSYFVPPDGATPWAHLDIAGVADTEKELPYYAAGATGWGVRTLVNWITRRSR